MKRGANAARLAECCKQSEKPAPRKSLPAAAVPHTHTHWKDEGGEGSKENCSWREIRRKSWLGTAIQTVMKVEETWGSFTHSWRAIDKCMPLGRHLTSSSLWIKKKNNKKKRCTMQTSFDYISLYIHWCTKAYLAIHQACWYIMINVLYMIAHENCLRAWSLGQYRLL